MDRCKIDEITVVLPDRLTRMEKDALEMIKRLRKNSNLRKVYSNVDFHLIVDQIRTYREYLTELEQAKQLFGTDDQGASAFDDKAFAKKKKYLKERKELEYQLKKEMNLEARKRIRANPAYEKLKREIVHDMNQQDRQVRDSLGNRWIRCKNCGETNMDIMFYSYGGNSQNTGKCRSCLIKEIQEEF